MSLVRYRVKNHPQQTGKRGARPEIDERAITLEDFAPLHERFKFTIDAAATPGNARLPRFWTASDNALQQSWYGERVWCNPPHSDIEPWVIKAHQQMGCIGPVPDSQLVVMLVPANRTEQRWWQRQVEPFRMTNRLGVEFLPGRMRFLAQHADSIKPNERPPYGCCLLIWGGENV